MRRRYGTTENVQINNLKNLCDYFKDYRLIFVVTKNLKICINGVQFRFDEGNKISYLTN